MTAQSLMDAVDRIIATLIREKSISADTRVALVNLVSAFEGEKYAAKQPKEDMAGYETAFYDLAQLLDIPASPNAPKEVWENMMMPRISELRKSVERFVDFEMELIATLEGSRLRSTIQNALTKGRLALQSTGGRS